MKLRTLKHSRYLRAKPRLTAEQLRAKVERLLHSTMPRWSDKDLAAMFNGSTMVMWSRLPGRATFRARLITRQEWQEPTHTMSIDPPEVAEAKNRQATERLRMLTTVGEENARARAAGMTEPFAPFVPWRLTSEEPPAP